MYIQRLVPRIARCFTILGFTANMGGGRARNFFKSQRLYRGPESIWGEIMEFFQVPGPSYREKGTYNDSHLASLLEVPQPI